MPDPARPALLVLETGQSFRGVSVGAPGERGCELVFHTGMTGYQEILTDPSYCGQGVVMTYPQIGNYGCQPEADESDRCWAEAMVMNRLSPTVSSWTATQDLASYLAERDVIGVTEVELPLTCSITFSTRER